MPTVYDQMYGLQDYLRVYNTKVFLVLNVTAVIELHVL